MLVARRASRSAEFEPGKLERFVKSNVCSLDYQAFAEVSPCLTQLGAAQFGAVDVFKHEGYGLRRGCRSLHHIRADHVDDFLISMPIKGRSTFMQMGTEVELEPGNFIISSTSKPLIASISSQRHQGSFQTYAVRVSGPLLRARVPRVDEYCHNPVRVDPGAGQIMASLFALAMQEGWALSEAQARSFGGMLIDSIANSARGAPELLRLNPESRLSSYARIREQAEHYIACNISNPALDPVLIALHCHVSVRYLYAAFAAVSKTLGALIRETRLERCRAALQSPDLRDRSVFEIALRWGFNDPAYFSRAYKARFGKTPKAERCFE